MTSFDLPHVFQASETDPSGIRVNVTIVVPAAPAWRDVREVAELAQMAASGAMGQVHRSRGGPARKTPMSVPTPFPDEWPPKPGDIWQDREGNRWVCTPVTGGGSYLSCLAHHGEDSAEAIWEMHGPMTRLYRYAVSADPSEVECPF